MTSFDRMFTQGQGYRKLRVPTGGSGPTPLNLAEPIGAATLQETSDSVRRQAGQVYQSALDRGAPAAQLERLASIANGEQAPHGLGGALTGIFNLLGVPGDLLRFAVMDIAPGGYNPTAQDYQDIISLQKQRIAARDVRGQLGRSGEMRGTDQLEAMGWDYVDDPKNPIDWINKVGRFIGSTGLDIVEDPLSLFTGGGGGAARSVATNSAESIVKQSVIQAEHLLVNLGDEALTATVRNVADDTVSPFVVRIAEKLQGRANNLATQQGRSQATTQELIQEASGLVDAQTLQKGLLEDARTAADDIFDEAAPQVERDLYSGRELDAFGNTTVWAEVNFDIVQTVAKKQFHRRDDLWEDYTNHVLHHMGKRDPGAVGSIGGLQFQIPFYQKSARSLGDLTKISQGLVSRVTRGEKFGLERLGTMESVARARTAWQEFRKTKGRQAAVQALRERGGTEATRRANYTGIVGVRMNQAMAEYLTSGFGVTIGADTMGGKLNQIIYGAAKQEDADAMIRKVGEAYIRGGQEVTRESLGRGAAKLKDADIDEINQLVRGMRKLQDMGDEAMARIDPRFRAMLDSADRTYSPVRVKGDVEGTVVRNRAAFDAVFDEWDAFKATPEVKRLPISEQVAAYARKLSVDTGEDIAVDDFVMYLDFINGFKRVRVDPGLAALGSTDVLRLRTMGTTARVIEETVEVMVDGKPQTVTRLRSVQDFQDIVDLDRKFTALANLYLPKEAKLKEVLITNPGELAHHWFTSVHSALSDRLFVHFMRETGYIKDPMHMVTKVGNILDRYARSETPVVADAVDLAVRFYKALLAIEEDEIPASALDNVIRDFGLNKIDQDIGGVNVSFPVAAYSDPAFSKAIAEMNLYLRSVTPSSRSVLQRQLLGAATEGNVRATDIESILTNHLQSRYQRIRNAVLKAAQTNVDTQLTASESVSQAAGATTEQMKHLLDVKERELNEVLSQMEILDAQHAAQVEALNKATTEGSINVKARQAAANKEVRRNVKTPVTAAKENYATLDEATRLLDQVIEKNLARQTEIAEALADSAREDRFMLGVEGLEYRRNAEDLKVVPTAHVERTDQPVTDAGWAVPRKGEADVWIEYMPGFGTSMWDDRKLKDGTMRGQVSFVTPEGLREGEAAVGFAKALGFTGNSTSIDEWWRTSFTQISYGLWRYNGGGSIPFYIVSKPDALGSAVFQNELTQVWNMLNAGTPVGETLKQVRLFGLQATGLKATAERSASQPLLDAISALRRKAPVADTTNPRAAPMAARQYVSAMELFDEEVSQQAQALVEAEGISLVDALARIQRDASYMDFVDRHRAAIVTRPRLLSSVHTEYLQSTQATAARELKFRPRQDRLDLRATPRSIGSDINEDTLSEAIRGIPNPSAHQYNLALAEALGIPDAGDLDPQDLFFELSQLEGPVLRPDSGFADAAPMTPWDEAVVPVVAVRRPEVARETRPDLLEYDPGYLRWLENMADELGMVTEQGRLEGYELDPSVIWHLEDTIAGMLDTPIGELYGGPIAWRQLPTLPKDAQHLIRSAARERFPGAPIDEVDPHLLLMRLQRAGWSPDSEDFLAYHELIPDTQIGATPGESDKLQEFFRGRDVSERLAIVDAARPQLESDYQQIVGMYRGAGSPGINETGNPFWSWYEEHYPGSLEVLGGQQQQLARVAAIDENPARAAGLELQAREQVVNGGKPSVFPEDPEEAWTMFRDKTREIGVHPDFAYIVEDYERAMMQAQSPGLIEKDLVATWFAVGPLSRVDDPFISTQIVDNLARNEGRIRADFDLSDPLHGSTRREGSFAFGDADRDQLAQAIDAADPDGTWVSRLEDRSTDDLNDYDAAAGLAGDTDVERVAAETGEDLTQRLISGAGLKPRQRLLHQMLMADAWIDLDQVELDAYATRYFASRVEPEGTIAAEGISRGTIENVDVAAGTNYPPSGLRHGETGEQIVGLEKGFGNTDPVGMDENYVDEFGNYQSISLDPRRRSAVDPKPTDQELNQIQVETQAARGVAMPGEPGQVFREASGMFNPRVPTAQGARETLTRFAQLQDEILQQATDIGFHPESLEKAAANMVYEQLIEEGDAYFSIVYQPRVNLTKQQRNAVTINDRLMAYVGVDVAKAQQAWDAFKLTRNSVFLNDDDLVMFFATRRGMKDLASTNLPEWTEVTKRLNQAALDIPPAESQPTRLWFRRQIEPTFKPVTSTPEIVERATRRGERTRAIGAGKTDDLFNQLKAMQVEQARQYRSDLAAYQVAGQNTPLRRVISGGQDGADRLGVEEGRSLGYETGGTAPLGFRTQKGNDPSLAEFSLTEHSSPDWPPRTEANVVDSDGTVIFTAKGREQSPGTKLTRNLARRHNKPYIENPSPEEFRLWLIENGIETVNVAGNREFRNRAQVRSVLEAGLNKDAAVTTTGFGRTGGVNVGRVTSGGVVGPRSGVPFGNPFPAGKGTSVADSVAQYEYWLDEQIVNVPGFKDDVADLSGQHLLCPGRKHSPCHAEVLANRADALAATNRVLEPPRRGGDGGSMDVGRHTGNRDNFGNPFYVETPDTVRRYRNKTHPLYRQRVVHGDPANPASIDIRWEPVPYTAVGSEAEANEKFYDMLWDMIDDEEFGPAVRDYLVTQLQGKVLYQYAGGANAISKALDAQVLADAVDWINDGWYHGQRYVPSAKGSTGRPRHNSKTPYLTPQEDAVKERIFSVVDRIGTESWLEGYARELEPYQRASFQIAEDAIANHLRANPQLLEQAFDPAILAEREAVGLVPATPQVKEMMADIVPWLRDNGAGEPLHSFLSLDAAFENTAESPLAILINRAAARVHGPYSETKIIPGPDGRSSMIQTTKPGSDQRAFLDDLDVVDANAARGYQGPEPVPLSMTLKELDEMGRDTAVARGHETAYEMSQAWSGLARQRDQLAEQIEQVRRAEIEGKATTEAKAQAARAQARIVDIDNGLSTIQRWMDAAWSVSMNGNNRKLRRFAGMQKVGDLPNGPEWDAFQKALDLLPAHHRHTVSFLIDTGLTADLHPNFAAFERYWFEQKNSALKVSKSLKSVLRQTYTEAQGDPLKWSEILSLDDALEWKIRSLFLDVTQLVNIHSNRADADALFAEARDMIGVGDETSMDFQMGMDLKRSGNRRNISELADGISDTLDWLEGQPTLRQLAHLKALGIDDAAIKRMRSLADQIKIRPEERTLFQQGVQGDFVGLAGDLENGVMREAVQMEFYKALGRMHLAADPRIGMEIFGAAQKAGAWWTKAATVARPTFHMRNLIGGLWNCWIAGVPTHEVMTMMPDVMRYVRNRRSLGKIKNWNGDLDSLIEGVLLDGVSDANRDVMAMAIRSGIMDSAFSSTLPRNIEGIHGMKAWNPVSADNRFFRGGSAAMEWVEGILRMSTFKHYYDDQFPHISAQLGRNMVNMVHFDYTDLSALDQWAKKFAPFWVWTSRNLPLQMRQLLGNPRMILAYQHAREAWNDNFAPWDEENREWLTSGQRWVLPFRKEDDLGNWVQLSWEPALPFTDMLELPLFKQTFEDGGYQDILGEGAVDLGQWVGWVSGSLAPQWSSIHDLATDPRDQWRQTNAPPVFNTLFKALSIGETTPQGDQRVSPTLNAVINTAIPFLTEYTEMAGVPTRSPYSAGNQGFLPSEYLTTRDSWPVPQVTVQRLGRGLGLGFTSPEDVYWTYKDWEAYIEQAHFMERSLASEPVE